MAENTNKSDTYDFLVDDCTHEQNGNPNCSYIVRQRKWLSVLRKNVEIQKFCYHGNVTSHFFSLFCCESCDAIFPPKQRKSKKMKKKAIPQAKISRISETGLYSLTEAMCPCSPLLTSLTLP